MEKFSKVWYSLKLTSLSSFFIFTFSSLMLKFLNEINGFLQNTYLTSLNNIINNIFTNGFFMALKWLSIIFLIGCLISFFIVFYQEVIKDRIVN